MDDLPEDWWTTRDVARFLDIREVTIRAYVTRGQMPPPDRRFGSAIAWRPDTIRKWSRTRRRGASGAGKD